MLEFLFKLQFKLTFTGNGGLPTFATSQCHTSIVGSDVTDNFYDYFVTAAIIVVILVTITLIVLALVWFVKKKEGNRIRLT